MMSSFFVKTICQPSPFLFSSRETRGHMNLALISRNSLSPVGLLDFILRSQGVHIQDLVVVDPLGLLQVQLGLPEQL